MEHFFPTKKTAGPDGFTGDWYQIFLNEQSYFFRKKGINRYFSIHFCVIILIPKSDIDIMGERKKKSYNLTFIMNKNY